MNRYSYRRRRNETKVNEEKPQKIKNEPETNKEEKENIQENSNNKHQTVKKEEKESKEKREPKIEDKINKKDFHKKESKIKDTINENENENILNTPQKKEENNNKRKNTNKRNNMSEDRIKKYLKTDIKKEEDKQNEMINKEVNSFGQRARMTMPLPIHRRDLTEVLGNIEINNINHLLKGDLFDIYGDIMKNYSGFKDKVFYKTLKNFENKVGLFDKKKVPHFISNDNYEERFNKYQKTDEILNEYAEKAKDINVED